MKDNSPETEVRLRWLSRPRRVVGFLVVVVIVGVLAFVAGWFVRSPNSSLTDAAHTVVPVFANVEERIVDHGFSAQGAVVAGERLFVTVSVVAGAERNVVSSAPTEVGDEVVSGSHLVSISDRPIFLLRLDVPLYRDLYLNTKGQDVSAVQVALGVTPTGKVDRSTLGAIRSLYQQAGTVPPGGTSSTFIAWREFVSTPPNSFPVTVASVAKLGSVLDSDDSVIELQVGPPQVLLRVSAASIGDLGIGSVVSIRTIALDEVSGVISNIGSFVDAQQGDAGEATKAGFDVRVDFAEEVDEATFPPGKSVTVSLSAATPPGLAVPILAVRQDTKGLFVLRSIPSGTERVAISVQAQSEGWASIQSSELGVGDRVQLAP